MTCSQTFRLDLLTLIPIYSADDEESTSAHHLGQHHRPEETGQVTEGHDDDDCKNEE